MPFSDSATVKLNRSSTILNPDREIDNEPDASDSAPKASLHRRRWLEPLADLADDQRGGREGVLTEDIRCLIASMLRS